MKFAPTLNAIVTFNRRTLTIAAISFSVICFASFRTAAAAQCCTELPTAESRVLPLGETTLDFGTDAPRFPFDAGDSPYVLFAIPERPVDKALRVDLTTIKAQGIPGFPRRTYFHPNVLVLDAARRQIGEVSRDAIRRVTTGLLDAAVNYSGTFIVGANSPARYLVFRTTKSLLAEASIDQKQCYAGAGGLWSCFNAHYSPNVVGQLALSATLIDE